MTRKHQYDKFAGLDDNEHDVFLNRISKTLYYTKFPVTDCLSLPVTELAAEIFTEVKNGKTLERLDVEEASRISRNVCVSPCAFVLALLYLERLKDCNPEYLQRVAPSELFLVTLMVASKFLSDDGVDDEVFTNEWAFSGNLSTAQMIRLERNFLKAINWSVYVHNQEFWERLKKLERDVAYKEARKRGWFSYTDLHSLLDTIHLYAFVNTIIQASTLFVTTYTIGVMAVLGSHTVASYLPEISINSDQTPQVYPSNVCNNNWQHVSHLVQNSPMELEEKIENILLDSSMQDTGICNKTAFTQEKECSENSRMIDLLNCPNFSNYSNNKFNYNCKQVTDTDYSLRSNLFSQHSDKEVESIRKSLDLSTFSPNWRSYVCYMSKPVLSY